MPCTVSIPLVCNSNPETVVAAHANSLQLGKGKSLKAPDWAIAFACSACHSELDQGSVLTEAERWEYWLWGHFATEALLWERGLVTVQ